MCDCSRVNLPLVMGIFKEAPNMLHLTWPGMSSCSIPVKFNDFDRSRPEPGRFNLRDNGT